MGLKISDDSVGTDTFVREDSFHVGDLRADMQVQALQVDIFGRLKRRDKFVESPGADAELVLFQAGGDVAVGMGVDVGIDADADLCGGAQIAGDGVYHLQLRD